ncbi:MAG TPA: hypothetical protein VEV43_13855 [Actinomycetota bacterium]|nr:hypothetical protein [Actinomycetota bacterium]
MATEILTGALVVITAYYAWQNLRMVQEMRAARVAAIQPRLVPTVEHLPAGHANLRVINVGPGAALDVDIHLKLDPGGPDIHYTTSVIPAGEFHDFMIPSDGGADSVITQLDVITATWELFRLTGTCRDVSGAPQSVDERLPLREYWARRKAALHVWHDEPLPEIAKRLKNIEKLLKKSVK